MIHIDETIDKAHRTEVADMVRAHIGVMGVAHHDETPHLMIVAYDPDTVNSQELLRTVLNQGLHAELIGL